MRPGEFNKEFHPFRWLFFILGFFFVVYVLSTILNVASLPFQAVNNTKTVVTRIIDPDNALIQYRWFHDVDAQLKVMPAQIRAAKANLEFAQASAPDHASARMTELTGILQVCERLVGDYNSRATRLDAGFFRNPERWLPVSTAPWEPLPQSYDTSLCEGATK